MRSYFRVFSIFAMVFVGFSGVLSGQCPGMLGSISGNVFSNEGVPAGGWEQVPLRAQAVGNGIIAATTANDDSSYEMDQVNASININVFVPSFIDSDGQRWTSAHPVLTNLNCNDSVDGVDVEIIKAFSQVSGTVTNAVTGQPLQGINVIAANVLGTARALRGQPTQILISTETDQQGHYSLSLPNGDFLLFTDDLDFFTEMEDINLDNEELIVDFSLQPRSKRKKVKFLLQEVNAR